MLTATRIVEEPSVTAQLGGYALVVIVAIVLAVVWPSR